MNHLDLFSGIGGFAYAAQQVWGSDHNVVAFVEKDKYCQKVLNKHWPEVPIFNDIKEYRYGQAEGEKEQAQTPTIDLLTGGFPCQPFSVAGRRKGKGDDRFLWGEMLRIIKESKPTFVIGENVAGIVNMELDNCISELESEGYETQAFIIPACAVSSPHRRDRVWIVAHSEHNGCDSRSDTSETGSNIKDGSSEENRQFGEEQGFRPRKGSADVANSNSIRPVQCTSETKQRRDTSRHSKGESKGSSEDVSYTNTEGLQGRVQEGIIDKQRGNKQGNRSATQCSTGWQGNRDSNWATEPNVLRVANGVPNRVDRLKGLGNAIVPQCVEPIMWAIKEIEIRKEDIG